MTASAPAQQVLPALLNSEAESQQPNEKIYAAAFKRLYYYLYSNSRASRAERIVSDLSNLLLCKIVSESEQDGETVASFLEGNGTANEVLFPLLMRSFPYLIDESDKFVIEDAALRFGLQELSALSFSSAPAHILGEAFQALMGPRLRGDKGQFFTPKTLVKAMVAILDPPVESKVVDPACGTGGFLVEANAFQAIDRKTPHTMGQLIGMDKDRDLCRLAEATLEIAAPRRATVFNVNSLDFEGLCALPPEITPNGADFVLTNPPFGVKIKVVDRAILKQYALGHKWSQRGAGWEQDLGVREAQDPQILFLELCVKLLKPEGQAAIVLPEGIFGNRSFGYVWDYLRSQGKIAALIDCPRTTFQPSTDIKTNVLFFQKNPVAQDPDGTSSRVWMAVALSCGHDRRGKTTKNAGDAYPDDIKEIGSSFKTRQAKGGFWQLTKITDPYYLVPRYYDAVPLQELAREAKTLSANLMSLNHMVKQGFLRVRKGHEVGAESYGTGDVPFIRTSDISNYEVSIDPNRSVSEEVYEQYKTQQQLTPGDILMVVDGRYRIGRTAILNEHNYRCIVQSHIRIFSVASGSPVNGIELLYLLNLPMVQHQIRNLIFIQSTLGSLGSRLFEIQVPIPERVPSWTKTIEEFENLIRGRALLLQRLRAFEPSDYEI